jgi:O-antigen ligase
VIPALARSFIRETTRQQRAARAAVALVVVSLLLGGQSVEPMLVQAIPQLLALVILAWLGWSARPSDFVPGAAVAFGFVAVIVLLVAAQLVPLPYGWWSALPRRDALLPAMQLADPGKPWHALSEDPSASVQSALVLLPAFAMLAVGLMLDREGLTRVVLAIAICALASLAFGTLQWLAGIDSPAYVYGRSEARLALGFFSNRNHQADMLCIGLLMAGAAQYALAPRIALVREYRLPIAGAAVVLFGLGVVFTASRTGALLFVPCAALTIAVAVRDGLGRRASRFARLSLVAAPLLFVAIGWAGLAVLAERMQSFRDLRFAIWPDAWYLARSVWQAGTGFGTFAPAYQRIESLAGVTPAFINAAHNDYLQLLVEGGIPAIALVLAFLGWFGRRVVQLVRHGSGMAGWFATAGILVLLLHSAVDYPLRTEALSTVFAALCAILNLARQPMPEMAALRGLAGEEPCPATD